MQFAAALLEYLVSGFVGLLWLTPLARHLFGDAVPTVGSSPELFLPAAYVLGILIDTTAAVGLERLRGHGSSASPYDRTTRILSRAPERLIKTMDVYVGRDRIARGVFMNAVIAGGVFIFILDGDARITAAGSCLVVAVWSFLVWLRLDRLSSGFKENALKSLGLSHADLTVESDAVDSSIVVPTRSN